MKSTFFKSFFAATFLFSGLAMACSETDLSQAARKLDLTGKVLMTAYNKKNVQIDQEEMSVIKADDESAKALTELANSERNPSEVLSTIFMSDDSEGFAIIRNLKTCKISVFGTDGEDVSRSQLLEVTSDSLKMKMGRTVKNFKKVSN